MAKQWKGHPWPDGPEEDPPDADTHGLLVGQLKLDFPTLYISVDCWSNSIICEIMSIKGTTNTWIEIKDI